MIVHRLLCNVLTFWQSLRNTKSEPDLPLPSLNYHPKVLAKFETVYQKSWEIFCNIPLVLLPSLFLLEISFPFFGITFVFASNLSNLQPTEFRIRLQLLQTSMYVLNVL